MMQCKDCKYMERFADGVIVKGNRTVIVQSGNNNYRCTRPIVSGLTLNDDGEMFCHDFEEKKNE